METQKKSKPQNQGEKGLRKATHQIQKINAQHYAPFSTGLSARPTKLPVRHIWSSIVTLAACAGPDTCVCFFKAVPAAPTRRCAKTPPSSSFSTEPQPQHAKLFGMCCNIPGFISQPRDSTHLAGRTAYKVARSGGLTSDQRSAPAPAARRKATLHNPWQEIFVHRRLYTSPDPSQSLNTLTTLGGGLE